MAHDGRRGVRCQIECTVTVIARPRELWLEWIRRCESDLISQPSPLPPDLEPKRALVGLQVGAEFSVVVEIEPRRAGDAQRRRGSRIRAILALADTRDRNAFRPQADEHRAELLR